MAKIQIPQIPIPLAKPRISCPDPMFDFPSPPFTYDPAEFSAQQLSLKNPNQSVPQKNSFYLYTIKWKPKRKCCQAIKAEVKLRLKAISPGTNPNTSLDAGNDSFVFVKTGGQTIKSSYIYPSGSSFLPGHSITKTFILNTPSELSWLNASGKLSFLVQDDTHVVDIKVKLTVCCLNELEK